MELTDKEVRFLLSAAGNMWRERPPKGLFAMSYHTLSYKDDLKLHLQYLEIRKKWKNSQERELK